MAPAVGFGPSAKWTLLKIFRSICRRQLELYLDNVRQERHPRGHAPFLAKTPKGIRLQFYRKFKKWISEFRVPEAIADRRKQNPGRPAPKLSTQEEHAFIANALRCGGGISQAWRDARGNGLFKSAIAQGYVGNPASKSYVPARIRKLVARKVRILHDHHHGTRTARLNSAYINRDP